VCQPESQVLSDMADQWQDLAPGYVGDNYYLARHEWQRHGSCSGLSDADFFAQELEAMNQMATAPMITSNIGKSVGLNQLVHAYGGADQVVFHCTSGSLDQVTTCWSHQDGRLGERRACPDDVLREGNCKQTVLIPAFGQCGR